MVKKSRAPARVKERKRHPALSAPPVRPTEGRKPALLDLDPLTRSPRRPRCPRRSPLGVSATQGHNREDILTAVSFEAFQGQYVMQNCELNPLMVLSFAENEWNTTIS